MFLAHLLVASRVSFVRVYNTHLVTLYTQSILHNPFLRIFLCFLQHRRAMDSSKFLKFIFYIYYIFFKIIFIYYYIIFITFSNFFYLLTYSICILFIYMYILFKK